MQACQIMIAALSEFHAKDTRRQICSARIFHGSNSNAKELATYVAMLETREREI
jgi:predicted transcriptional regulator